MNKFLRRGLEGIIILGILLVLYQMVFKTYFQKRKLCKDGVITKGIISGSGYTDISSAKGYKFNVNGSEYHGSFEPRSTMPAEMNDTVEVVYLPNDPKVNAIPDDLNNAFYSWKR